MSDQESKEEEGFIGRWSARKRGQTTHSNSDAVFAGSQAIPDSTDASPLMAVDSDGAVDNRSAEDVQKNGNETNTNTEQPLNEKQEQAPLLSDEDMPPITSLTAKSDISDFFNKGVSAGLRRAALRHVFQLPVYNERDGLNDYDDDFTKFEPLGDTITSDMKWHKARKEREAEEAAAQLKADEEQARQELEEAEAARLEEQGEQSESQSDVEEAQSEDHSNQDDIESSERQQGADDLENEMDTEQQSDPVESDAPGAHA